MKTIFGNIQAKAWYFRNEWTLCRCPYDKKETISDRILLVGKTFNLKNSTIALLLYFFKIKPCVSTFIDEETITMGYGKDDNIGCFEYPLPDWIIKRKYHAITWKKARFKRNV